LRADGEADSDEDERESMDVVLPLLPAAVVVVVVVGEEEGARGEENEGRKSELLRRGITGAESGASPEPVAALLPLLGRLALSAEKNEDRPPDLGAEDEEDVDIDDGDEEDDDEEASAAGAEVFLPSGAWKDEEEGMISLRAAGAPRGGGELPSSSSSKGLGAAEREEEEGRVVGDAGRGTSGGTTANSSSSSLNGLAEQPAALTCAAESPSSSSSSKGFSDPPCPDISCLLHPINKLKEHKMYFLDSFFSSSSFGAKRNCLAAL
jgi:hypothetical protein